MGALAALLTTTGVLTAAGAIEYSTHRRRLKQIPIRIHVNGTRGKSSVARLIAAGMREGGIRTCCKTTGTLPRMILPDGSEYPVFRPAKANVIEQLRIVATAVEMESEALVLECMALTPHLQWLSENKLVNATHAVVTNTREDHLEVMGPTERDVALAIAGMTPPNGKLFTAERDQIDVFEMASRDRKCQLIQIQESDIAGVTDGEMSRFSYVEHAENVALALKVCRDLNIDRSVALRGMWNAKPDSGAMMAYRMSFFEREINFVNGFAANDPESTEQIWKIALDRYPDVDQRIAVFNCRADRPDRSNQLGSVVANWPQPDHYLLIGSGTYIFAKAATRAGIDPMKMSFAENRRVDEIFENIVDLAGQRALVMGMANIGGVGLELVRYFGNRSSFKKFE